jgi:nitroreductase
MADSGHPPDHLTFLKSLRGARHFLDKPVPQPIVDDALAAARDTAGDDASNWRYLVIDDLVTRTALAETGTFSEILAQTAVVIVVIYQGSGSPGAANMDGRISDRIMRTAGEHGLGCGHASFRTERAQAEVREILGIPPTLLVRAAVGMGYVDESGPGPGTTLQSAQQSVNRLAGIPEPDSRGR